MQVELRFYYTSAYFSSIMSGYVLIVVELLSLVPSEPLCNLEHNLLVEVVDTRCLI